MCARETWDLKLEFNAKQQKLFSLQLKSTHVPHVTNYNMPYAIINLFAERRQRLYNVTVCCLRSRGNYELSKMNVVKNSVI